MKTLLRTPTYKTQLIATMLTKWFSTVRGISAQCVLTLMIVWGSWELGRLEWFCLTSKLRMLGQRTDF